MAWKILSAVGLLIILTYNLSSMVHGIDQFLDKTMLLLLLSFGMVYSIRFVKQPIFFDKFGEGVMLASWIFSLMGAIVVVNSPFFGELHFAEIGASLVPVFLYILYGFVIKSICKTFNN